MEVLNVLSVLLVAILVVGEAVPTGRHEPHCSKIRGKDCTNDIDCGCRGHRNSTPLICNYDLKCEKESFYDTMTRRLPCFRVYKNHCTTDADCSSCREARLICEDNECVREKSMFV